MPGLANAQAALLASLIFEAPTAANPMIVVETIRRLGWDYAPSWLDAGTVVVGVVGLFKAILLNHEPLVLSMAFWGFWVVSLGAAMVVQRIFGLFCHHHSDVRPWPPGSQRSSA